MLAIGVLALGCSNARTPDVILVTFDTTRADHLGPYGYDHGTTPRIDEFARSAIVYDHAWSTSAWTLPAHASMLTGRYPSRHGARFAATGESRLSEAIGASHEEDHRVAQEFRAHRLEDSETTLAEILKDRGYATAAFVGGPWLHPSFGLLQGYDHRWSGSDSLSGARADAITDAAIEWIARVPRDQPIHLLVNYFDPHRPYDPPPGYDSLPGAQDRGGISDAEVIRLGGLPEPERRRITARYDGEIRFMDHHFGRLVDALQRASRLDDALVTVVGDHGEAFGELGAIGHTYWLYESILRVPLIVRNPKGRGGGSHDDRSISIADLLPLISRIVPLDLREPIDGVGPGGREFVFAELERSGTNTEYDRDLIAAIRWPWKLIESTDGREEVLRLDGEALEERATPPPTEHEALREALESLRASYRQTSRPSQPVEPPEKVREQLRSLGYSEGPTSKAR